MKILAVEIDFAFARAFSPFCFPWAGSCLPAAAIWSAALSNLRTCGEVAAEIWFIVNECSVRSAVAKSGSPVMGPARGVVIATLEETKRKMVATDSNQQLTVEPRAVKYLSIVYSHTRERKEMHAPAADTITKRTDTLPLSVKRPWFPAKRGKRMPLCSSMRTWHSTEWFNCHDHFYGFSIRDFENLACVPRNQIVSKW